MRLDVDGLVKIDVVNPPDEHRVYLEKEYPFIVPRPLIEDGPDARLMFRNNLVMHPEQAHLVRAPVGYDADGVFWFDPKRQMARIDFNGFADGTSPLLISTAFNTHFLYILVLYLLSFKLMAQGGVFCHGAAVRHKKRTILFPAWRHSGKTNLILSLLKEGAELIADDGVWLFKNGEMISCSKRLHLLYFNYAGHPHLLPASDDATQTLIQFVENVRSGCYGLSPANAEAVQKLVRVRMPGDTIAQTARGRHRCDLVIHLNKGLGVSGPPATLSDVSLNDIAVKCAESTRFEMMHLLSAYQTAVLTQGVYDPLLADADRLIFELIKTGLSHCGQWRELTFHRKLEANDALNLINQCL